MRSTVAVLLLAMFVSGGLALRRNLLKPGRRLSEKFDFESSSESAEEEWDEGGERNGGSGYRVISVCKKNETALVTVEGDSCAADEKPIAIGKYRNDVNTTGWGVLEIETFAGFQPEIQAYAAGVAEGVLTKLQIQYHYKNTVDGMCKGFRKYCKKLFNYLQKNLDWIEEQVMSKPPTDIYWRQVNLTFTQLTGLWDGYWRHDSFPPSVDFYITPILMLQLSGELFDLTKVFHKQPDNASQLYEEDPEPGRCSGFVKIAEDNADLFMSHVAMSGYNTMNRVLKLYKFAFDQAEVPGNAYSLSAYAGVLASADDYTLINSGLLSIETTISVFNESLYANYVKPENQLHCWLRSIVANQLARTAEEWVEIFARYNSGTYNNQWTVLDYKTFTPGQELPNQGVIWVLEQVPGFIESKDVTWFLKKYGYWPSYNIPFLKHISRLSGFDAKGAQNNWWKWGLSPRARMFHRDHHKVKDLNSLKNLMRYNNYTHDEFSRCECNPPYTAEAAISTRGDLNPANGTYELSGMGHRNHGSLDYKGTNSTLFKQLRFQAIGGPTYDPLPAFSWATTDIQTPHFGQPTLWEFKPLITEWETNVEMSY